MKKDKKVKVLPKNTTKKRASTKNSKKQPIYQSAIAKFKGMSRIAQLAVFGVVFAAIGGGYYLYHSRAAEVLPSNPHELVMSYEVGMTHTYFEDNFTAGGSGYSMLLYGNGLMLCNSTPMSMSADGTMDSSATTWNSRQLGRDDVRTLVDNVKAAGFDKAASYKPTGDIHYPAATGRFIRINFTQGYDEAATYPNYPDTGFSAAENVVKAECAKTTTPYEAETTEAQTILLADDSPEISKATKELPAGLDVDSTPKQAKSKSFTGQSAKDLKTKLQTTPQLYKQGGKVVRARYIDRIPDWAAMKPKVASSKGKVYAAGDLHTRWLIVLGANQNAPSWATGTTVSDDANNIRSWYAGKVAGKYFDVSQAKVIRGSKTAQQYRTCPSGVDCLGSASLAALFNLEREFPYAGLSTQFITAFDAGGGCNGWGDQPGINDGWAAQHGVYGLTNASANGCYWVKGKRVVAAHELGHNFGLAHTCNGTLMDGAGCPATPDWPYITLDGGQAAALSAYSPFFNVFSSTSTGGGTTTTTTCPNTLSMGGILYAGQTIKSPDCGCRLVMQTDGNLVLYSRLNHAIWYIKQGATRLSLQTDSNLVLRNSAGTAVWASGTKGSGGNILKVQNDGNVVLYGPSGAVWSTHTAGQYNN